MVSLRTRVRPIVGRIAVFAGAERIYRLIGVGVCCRYGLGQLELWGQRGWGEVLHLHSNNSVAMVLGEAGEILMNFSVKSDGRLDDPCGGCFQCCQTGSCT